MMVEAFDTEPLYKGYNTEIDTFLNVDNMPEDTYELDEINSRDTECLLAQQHTLLQDEEKYLEIFLGQTTTPLALY
jgi:hypothetical protein